VSEAARNGLRRTGRLGDLDAGYRSAPGSGEKENPTAGVAGRTVNREIPGTGGKVIGVGGQWIDPTGHRVVSLVAELDLDLYGTNDEFKHTVEFDGTLNRRGARGSCASPPVRDPSRGFVVPVVVAFRWRRYRAGLTSAKPVVRLNSARGAHAYGYCGLTINAIRFC
jgi:hypothetical protein